jgi:hypothetical protein
MAKRMRLVKQLQAKPQESNEDLETMNFIVRTMAQVSDKFHVLVKNQEGFVDEKTGREYTQENLERNQIFNKDHIYWVIK